MARLRSAPAVHPSPPKPQSKRQALKEKTNTSRAKAPVYENDGNTEDLVKDGRPRRGRPRKAAQKEDDFVMTGGLGQAEEAARDEMTVPTTDELAKSDAPAPPTAKANRRTPRMTRKPVQNEAQSKVLEGLKKRMEATARKEAGGRKGSLLAKSRASDAAEPSSDTLHTKAPTIRQSMAPAAEDISIYDSPRSPPPPGKLSSVRKRSSIAQPPPTSVLRPHATPGIENSVLKNFKRRPRQPSMLAMVQQRAASARPSAVNAVADEDPSVFDFDAPASDEEDEDDFAPDAEGTPLQISKAKRKSAGSVKKKPAKAGAAPAAKPVPAKKRKSGEAALSSGALESLRAKRNKSINVEATISDEPLAAFERASTRRKSSTETESQPTSLPQGTSDEVQVINSSQSTPPPAEPDLEVEPGDNHCHRSVVDEDYIVPSTEEQPDFAVPAEDEQDDELDDNPLAGAPNGTMAEPASSSPVAQTPSATQRRRADELADPVTQVSPPPEREQHKSKEKQKPMSTATLQSLLPKRRQPLKPRHRKSEYDFVSEDSEGEGDLDVSHLEEDEDELGGRLRKPAKPTPAKGRKSTAPTTAKAKGRQSKAPPPSRKSTAQPQASKASKKGAKATKTYGRAAVNTTSDKENQGDDDGFETLNEDNSAELPQAKDRAVAKSSELEAAKRKFAEVDEWDMEFESLGDEEHRSSSQQWR